MRRSQRFPLRTRALFLLPAPTRAAFPRLALSRMLNRRIRTVSVLVGAYSTTRLWASTKRQLGYFFEILADFGPSRGDQVRPSRAPRWRGSRAMVSKSLRSGTKEDSVG